MIPDEKFFYYIESLEKLINMICLRVKALERFTIYLSIMLIITLIYTVVK